ncbi:MAG TPA: Gfo/Idh/MocA family oxidoreductase, partial [Roseiflexaceae bacterium]|nr:Gfo/Idh/MocA family oxidoreductase [Roseiflexaceae bacterium]
PHLLRITSRDPGPPPLDYIRRSGGLFLDMMIHDFDMARFLLGDEVVAVSATGTCLVDPAIGTLGDIDTAIVTLTFAGGAIGVIDNSRRAVYGYDQRAEVLGDAGAVAVDNRAQHTATVRDAQAAHGALPPHFFIERYTDAYVAELQAFVDALRRGEAPPVGGADGRAPVVIALAAQRSLHERRPVAIGA